MNRRFRILVLPLFKPEEIKKIERLGEVIALPRPKNFAGVDPEMLAGVDAVFTSLRPGFSKEMFEACPRARIVHCYSVGYETIDLAEARRRNIPVTSARGANAIAVADHALALALGVLRDIPRYDRQWRAGTWQGSHAQPQLSGKRVGLAGVGQVGMKIGRRLAGFDAEILYTATARKQDLPWTYCATLRELAETTDILFLACPATEETYHMVDKDILQALGPRGFLINVARGSVVDTPALIEALRTGAIAGAAIDVLEGEPRIPPEFADIQNLLITPHMAADSPEARAAMLDIGIENISAALTGGALVNLV